MKIALAAQSKELEDNISPISGRAPYYLIFEDGELIETIKNPFARGGGGAGFGVAQMLINKGVELVISGHFGENMKQTLQNNGIQTKEIKEKSIKEIIATLQEEKTK